MWMMWSKQRGVLLEQPYQLVLSWKLADTGRFNEEGFCFILLFFLAYFTSDLKKRTLY